MILNKPHTSVAWFSRYLSLSALTCLLALVGGLSVVTLQPLAAEDEPKQQAPASVVEHPLGPLPASPPATPTSQVIELSCIAIELEPAELAKALSGGEHPPLPSPAVELGIQTAGEWRETLRKLEANPSRHVVSRPVIRTLNNRQASLQIAIDTINVEGRDDVLGLKVDLQPELLPMIGNEQQLLLAIRFERTALNDSNSNSANAPSTIKRQLQTKVAVPLGKVVVVADPSNRSPRTERPLLLAIEPRLVAQWEEARIATPKEVEAASRREAAAVRHTLLRLQREIAALLAQTAMSEAAANPLAAPAEPAAASNRQNTKRGKVAQPAETRNPPQFIPVNGDPEKASAQLQMRMKELKIGGVTIGVDSKSGSLIVSGSEQQVAEVRKLLFELDQTAAATAEQQLQRRLLELDLREAEIGLQVAKAEHEQMAEIRSKNPAALSNSELRHSQLKVDLAQVQVERTKVRLEAARAANPPSPPAASRR